MDDDANGDRDERTIFVGGLSEKNTEAILYELFFQAGNKNKFRFVFQRLKCLYFKVQLSVYRYRRRRMERLRRSAL